MCVCVCVCEWVGGYHHPKWNLNVAYKLDFVEYCATRCYKSTLFGANLLCGTVLD